MITPPRHSEGEAACDHGVFDPRSLQSAGQWISENRANAVMGQTPCTESGTWLVTADYVSGWSVDPAATPASVPVPAERGHPGDCAEPDAGKLR